MLLFAERADKVLRVMVLKPLCNFLDRHLGLHQPFFRHLQPIAHYIFTEGQAEFLLEDTA
ncbi:hypothetical protein D3C73_1030370 [compost metagenome]